MRTLTTLNLFENLFESGSGLNEGLMGLVALTELNISKNQFGGAVPSCIARFTDLLLLDISCNYFEGPLPLGVICFQQRRAGTTLRINENNNILFPKNIGLLGLGIVEMSLDGVGIRGSIPSSFGDLLALRHLSLPNNHLSGGIPESFSSLVRLEELVLGGNELSGGFSSNLSNLLCLKVLDMSENADFDASFPSSFSLLRCLEFIDLHGCRKANEGNNLRDDGTVSWVPHDIHSFVAARNIAWNIERLGEPLRYFSFCLFYVNF